MNEAIRLTNRTAIALRRSAQRVRMVYFVSGVILSLLLGAAGVLLGFLWLPAVPLMLLSAALLDGALAVLCRSRYLSLLGQAICTEAAAREIRAGRSESLRREQAISDLIRAKADVQCASPAKMQEETGETERVPEKPKAHARRRRQRPLQLIRSEQVEDEPEA